MKSHPSNQLIEHGFQLTKMFLMLRERTGVSDLNELAEAVSVSSGAEKEYIVLAVKAYFNYRKGQEK